VSIMISKRTKVGGRSLDAIRTDPLATASELQRLAEKAPELALEHPNCPQALWWRLASMYPLAALRGPVGALFLLEEPDRWAELELRCAKRWVRNLCNALMSQDKIAFAVDCAAHVLPLFASKYPSDQRLRQAIAVARRHTDYRALNLADDAVSAAIQQAKRDRAGAAHQAAEAVQCALRDDMRGAINYAYTAAYNGGCGTADKDACEANECLWQWHRLVGYLRGEGKG